MTIARTSQKRTFTQSVAAHGNVRRAMREAGLTNPTTAYRWLAAFRSQGIDWYRSPSRPTRQVPADIADMVVRTAEYHPGWGKQRIARHIVQDNGAGAISPNGVRSVLHQAGLWSPTPDADLGHTPLDPERIVAISQQGIHLDLGGEPHRAVMQLDGELWRPLLADRRRAGAFLQEPEAGSWALRGLLQLAHAFIDLGRWRSALVVLTWLEEWLREEDARPSPEQASIQNEGLRYFDRDEASWKVAHASSLPRGGLEPISLRTDEIWLEVQQYLALVVRESRPAEAVERLAAASRAVDRADLRVISPERRNHYRGIVEHDLVVAQIDARWPPSVTLQSIDHTLSALVGGPCHGMLASLWLQAARVYQSKILVGNRHPIRIADRMELAIDRALHEAMLESSPMLRANVDLQMTELLLAIRPATPEDRERIANLADLVVRLRLAGRARGLLLNPAIRSLVADHRGELQTLAQQ